MIRNSAIPASSSFPVRLAVSRRATRLLVLPLLDVVVAVELGELHVDLRKRLRRCLQLVVAGLIFAQARAHGIDV